MQTSLFDCDVVIIGGGPAGTATAIELRRRTLEVVLLERSNYIASRIGETLPPVAQVILQQLGVWETFLQANHAPSPGIVSLWGDTVPYENDFIFTPYGHGWHLNRAQFDLMLANAARSAGAHLHQSQRIHHVAFTEGGVVVRFAGSGSTDVELRTRIVVDATGRGSTVAQSIGVKRESRDRLTALVGLIASDSTDLRTYLEAQKTGWWYAAQLPERTAIVAFMTDADLLPRSGLRDCLLNRVEATQLIASAFHLQELAAVKTVSACTSRLSRVCGERWLAVGDAAMSFDPLSSAGIVTALESGGRAAEAIAAHFAGQPQALRSYARWSAAAFSNYERGRAYYYSQVSQWPDAEFWRRRNAPSATVSVSVLDGPGMHHA